MTNRLYYGDNLDWLSNPKAFPDASVDLVYLDPPFNSNATYSQIDAFDDTWSWGMVPLTRVAQDKSYTQV